MEILQNEYLMHVWERDLDGKLVPAKKTIYYTSIGELEKLLIDEYNKRKLEYNNEKRNRIYRAGIK